MAIAIKAPKTLTIVAREEHNGTIEYYIQSGDEHVYVATLENGKTSCKHFETGATCEAYLYSPRNHKGCKHTTLALKNEAERSTDQHIHVQDDQRTHGVADRKAVYSCTECGRPTKIDCVCPTCQRG